jgi:hypothetical protein
MRRIEEVERRRIIATPNVSFGMRSLEESCVQNSEKCPRVMCETWNKGDPTGLHNRLLIRSRATPSASPIAELA